MRGWEAFLDGQRFDQLARAVARSSSRRSLLRAAAGGAGAGVLALFSVRDGSADDTCKPANRPQSKCKKDAQCCAGPVCGPDRLCQPGCRIDGTFYGAGVEEPGNACRTCQPEVNTTEWFDAAGVSCDHGDPCVGPGTCSSGLCQRENSLPVSGACADGAGVCVDGACCTNGPLATADFCNPEVNTSVCCADADVCCALEGCCRDCFRYSSDTDGSAIFGYVYECCSEENLCPPRSSPDENPTHCCSGSASVCISDHPTAADGCYRPEQVCPDGGVCDVPCCRATCCGPDTICAEGECRSAHRSCATGEDCLSGEQCVGAGYQLICGEEIGGCEEQVVAPGECCAGRQIGSIPYEPTTEYVYTKDFCCEAGLVSGADGAQSPGSTCCTYDSFLRCNACHTQCTPNGGRTRI